MAGFLTWIEASALGHAVRESGLWTYAIINLAHVLGVATLFGSILVLDLRLLGAWRSVPLDNVIRTATPVAGTGFALAAVSGICLLSANGSDYIGNPLLFVKFPAIALGLINVAIVRRTSGWRPLAGAISLACWLTALAAGRMIAYW